MSFAISYPIKAFVPSDSSTSSSSSSTTKSKPSQKFHIAKFVAQHLHPFSTSRSVVLPPHPGPAPKEYIKAKSFGARSQRFNPRSLRAAQDRHKSLLDRPHSDNDKWLIRNPEPSRGTKPSGDKKDEMHIREFEGTLEVPVEESPYFILKVQNNEITAIPVDMIKFRDLRRDAQLSTEAVEEKMQEEAKVPRSIRNTSAKLKDCVKDAKLEKAVKTEPNRPKKSKASTSAKKREEDEDGDEYAASLSFGFLFEHDSDV